MSNTEMPLSELAKLPFGDSSEVVAAITDPRYSRSPAYRDCVAARLAISEGVGLDSTHVGKQSNAIFVRTSPVQEDPAPSDKATISTLIGGTQRVTMPSGTISEFEADRAERDRLLGYKELLTEALAQEKKAQGVE